MAADLVAIDPGAERRQIVRDALGRVFEKLSEMDDVAGFAVVSWDSRGGSLTAVHQSEGPISLDLVPAYASHQLVLHVAATTGAGTSVEQI